MLYTRDWTESDPIDHTKFNAIATQSRNIRKDLAERMDSQFYGFINGETDEGVKKLLFKEQASAPTVAANFIGVYAKEVSGVAELFFKDESGNETQITSGGKINQAAVANVANNTYIKSKDAAGSGTVDLIKANALNIPVVPDGIQTATNAAPTDEKGVSNKKYVDDSVASLSGQTVVMKKVSATTTQTQTTTTYADLDSMSISLTPRDADNPIEIDFVGSFDHTAAAGTIWIAINIDGSDVAEFACHPESTKRQTLIAKWATTLSVAAHTIKVRWKCGSTGNAGTVAGATRILTVKEYGQGTLS